MTLASTVLSTANFGCLKAMDPVPVSVLKFERCPRLSAEDLIELLDFHHERFVRPKVIVVDVRSSHK